MKYTRKQYMSGEVTFQQYYGQFVTQQTKNTVTSNISVNRLLASTDEHLNDIPLIEWDRMHGLLGGNSLCETVCIAKEAARQIIEENS